MGLALAAGLSACSPGGGTQADREAAPAAKPAPSAADSNAKLMFRPMAPEVYGPEVYARDYPWQVGLKINYGEGWPCGGIIISRSYILTAAHCVDASGANDPRPIPIGPNDIAVFHGSDTFGQGVRLVLDPTRRPVFHPKWKQGGPLASWDAALLRLKEPLPASAIPAPVRTVAFAEGPAVVSGWGDYDATDEPSLGLRAVAVPVVGNATCRAKLPAAYAPRVGDFTLCSVSDDEDACAHDSGGPLVVGSTSRPQTIGIVSWGPPGSCGVPGPGGARVGAYTRGSAIAAWVRSETGDAAAVTNAALDPLFAIRRRSNITGGAPRS
jgi:trypsin